MTNEEKKQLERKCKEIRYLTIDEIAELGVGHVGGSLSAIEALVVVYYKHMNINPKNPKMEGRDRFVLSKAHSGPALYAVLADKGFFDKSWLYTLNKPDTRLPSHVNMNLTPGVDMTAGSLGQGLSCAVGIAIASKIRKDNARVYCMIGDGESNEGQIWEAAMFAGHKKLDNLIVFTDYNKMQIDGLVNDIVTLEPLKDKWEAFGFNVLDADGHSVEEIDGAISKCKEMKGRPSMIILNTLKGKGVSFIEEIWQNNHSITISPEQRQAALKELED